MLKRGRKRLSKGDIILFYRFRKQILALRFPPIVPSYQNHWRLLRQIRLPNQKNNLNQLVIINFNYI